MKLELPTYEFKTKTEGKNTMIFDRIRSKYVVLTPEEWVRQNFVEHLISHYKYSANLIAVEKQIKVANLTKRIDIAVYNTKGEIDILVECKAPNVEINQATFDQISRYNSVIDSKYLIVTNGITHIYSFIDKKAEKYVFLKDLPIQNY